MNIELIIQLLNALKTEQPTQESAFEVGKMYVVRTLTMTTTGKLIRITPQELVFSDAAWIADSGRWNEFVCNPEATAKEVEMYSRNCIVGRVSVIDATEITTLPKATK